MKISIITAIHNGLALNKIFVESIEKYTQNEYELIIIDNVSTDGSAAFFNSKGAIVIQNTENYSYPHCQNQGIRAATGDYLFFLNNDLYLSPAWDKKLIEIANLHQLDLISASGIENMGTKLKNQQIGRQWKRVKNPLSLFGFSETNLRLMLWLMYGNWEKYCKKLADKYNTTVMEGIVGDNVMMTRRALDIVGYWDEQIQQADWDIFMRVKKRHVEVGDIKPIHVALGVYIHHFGRMTLKYGKKTPIPFYDKDNLILLGHKWTEQEIKAYDLNPKQ